MLRELFFILWFFLPAGLANIAAFFSGKLAILKEFPYPLDFNLKFHNKRLLGSHKTIRGMVSGVIIGILIVWLETVCYHSFGFVRQVVHINYTAVNPFILGSLAGFGGLIGDAVKSFFKRQMNIAPGKSWFPFDQIDYIFGGIICMAFYIRLSFWEYVLLFIVWFLMHPLTTLIGYLLKLKEKPL